MDEMLKRFQKLSGVKKKTSLSSKWTKKPTNRLKHLDFIFNVNGHHRHSPPHQLTAADTGCLSAPALIKTQPSSGHANFHPSSGAML